MHRGSGDNAGDEGLPRPPSCRLEESKRGVQLRSPSSSAGGVRWETRYERWPILKNPDFRRAHTSCSDVSESGYALASRSL